MSPYPELDFATNSGSYTWRFNEATKPDGAYKYTGSWDTNGVPVGPGQWVSGDGRVLGMKTYLYEILAFAAQPRSLALGAQAVGGPFGTNDVDLSSARYGFTNSPDDHGGQFSGTEAQREPYWHTLLRDIGITGWSSAVLGIPNP
jgi:hypothetical protein